MNEEGKTKKQLINEIVELRQRILEVEEPFKEFKKYTAGTEKELHSVSMELAISLFEVFEALKKISSGDPEVRIAEESEVELISKLKYMVNMTAKNIAEMVEQSHEFAMGLAEHFDVLHRVSEGDLSARVSGESTIELIEALKKVTNETIRSISEAEEELRRSEERYRTVFENTGTATAIVEGDIISMANTEFENLCGYSREEIVGKKSWTDFVMKDDLESWKEHYRLWLIDPISVPNSYEFRFMDRHGHVKDVFMTIEMIPGTKISVASLLNITELKKTEVALRKSEEKYRQLIENTNDIVCSISAEGVINYIGPQVRRYGFSEEEIVSQPFLNFIVPDDKEDILIAFQKTMTTGAEFITQFRITDKKGNIHWIEENSKVQRDESGKIIGIYGVLRDITEHKHAEEEIKMLSSVVEQSTDGMAIAGLDGNLIFTNEAWCRMHGYKSCKELLGKSIAIFHNKEQIENDVKPFNEKVIELGAYSAELGHITRDGKPFLTLMTTTLLKDKQGKPYALAGVAKDITERKRAEAMMQKLRDHNELILNSAAEGIIGLDSHGNHTFVNPSAASMLGYEVEELIGKHSHTIWHYSKADGSIYPEVGCPIYTTLKDGKVHHNVRDEVFWKKDGTSFSVAYSSNPIMDEGKIIGAVVNFRDITERKHMAEKLQYLAYYDALTDLPNRNLFFDRINQAIARAERTSRIVAVLITNINKFKSINDTYGSEIGDRVLKEIARRLSTSVRKGDTIARLSNDEFGIALLDVAHPDNIVKVLEKIIKDISYPLKADGDELALTFSTGVSVYPNDGNSASELLKAAGLALGMAKKEGRRTYQFFTEDLNTKASEFFLMEKNLYNAIKNEEFLLHYQPYWEVNTQKMVGMEALIRWQSKDMGLVSPGKFIPILEDTGMIIEVGERILRTAMGQVKEWQNNGYPVVPVSVNMSLVQFRQKDLAKMVKRIMGECGFYPSLLTLEITESAFMQDIEFTESVLTAMKGIGCSVSIDDFGTGYSSLAYLKRLPVDNLKIDISFIRDMVKDPDSASIVMAIINMAHTLQLKTIAEGIETEEQWKFLRLLRCDMGQGFYLSKPLPAEDIEKLFK